MERNSELVESLLQLRIDLLRTVFVPLRSRIVNDILEVYLRNVQMRPCRQRHLLPAAECLETELEHPLRLVLLCRNQAYYIFIETLGNELLLHIGHEAVLVFLVCNAF